MASGITQGEHGSPSFDKSRQQRQDTTTAADPVRLKSFDLEV